MGLGLRLMLGGLPLLALLEEGFTSNEPTELALVERLYDQAARPFRPRTRL